MTVAIPDDEMRVYEAQVRREAKRRGMILRKRKKRDPEESIQFDARYALLDARTGDEVNGYEFCDERRWADPSPYRLTLFEAGGVVDGEKVIGIMPF